MTRFVRHISALSIAEAVSRLLAFAATVYLARVLGPSSFGVWNYVLAVYSYFGLFVAGGTESIAIREIAKGPHASGVVTTSVFRIRSYAVVLSWVIIGLFLLSGIINAEIGSVFLLQAVSLLLFPWSLHYYFQAKQRGGTILTGKLISGFLFLGLLFLVVKSSSDLTSVPLASLLAIAISQFALLGLYSRDGERFFAVVKWKETRSFLIWSAPLGAAGLLTAVLTYADMIILGLFRSEWEVGMYAVGTKVLLLFAGIQSVLGQSLLPVFSASERESEPRTDQINTRLIMMIGGGSVLLAAIAPEMCRLVYGDSYADAGGLMRVLSLAGGMVSASAVPTQWLIARNQQRQYLIVIGLAAVVNVSLNAVFVPRFGARAAALTALAVHTFGAYLLTLILVRTRQRAMMRGIHPLAALMITSVCGVGMLGGYVIPSVLGGGMLAGVGIWKTVRESER